MPVGSEAEPFQEAPRRLVLGATFRRDSTRRKSGLKRLQDGADGFRPEAAAVRSAREPIADLDLVGTAKVRSDRSDHRRRLPGPHAPEGVAPVAISEDQSLGIRHRERMREEMDLVRDGGVVRHGTERRRIRQLQQAETEARRVDRRHEPERWRRIASHLRAPATRDPLDFPSSAGIASPAAQSRPRSTPVSISIPSSMYMTSSVATLPVAPGA